MNCSPKLDWREDIAPVVIEYMYRMKRAGYSEKYRRDVLRQALGIYNSKVREDEEGVRPLFRPKDWKKEERANLKRKNKHEWATKGGCLAPIFVPSTPGGELMKRMKKVINNESKAGVKFKLVEVGGRTLKSSLQTSNPTGTPACQDIDCICCSTQGEGTRVKRKMGGSQCRISNVNYEIECLVCQEGDRSFNSCAFSLC